MTVQRSILVTGGAGFVGSNLAVLFKTKHPEVKVVALDNLKRRGAELNLLRLAKAGVRFVHGDVRNREDLDLKADGFIPDTIIECSAEPSVTAGYNTSPEYLINTNLGGTVNCLELARATGAQMIFLSTSRVYPIERLNALAFTEDVSRFKLSERQSVAGACANGVSELFPMDGPRSMYGATKLSSEHLIEEYRAAYGVQSVVNRCGVIAGPWQMGKVDQGVFVHWMASHYYKRDLAYFGYNGSGKQVRDLLHIEDLYSLVEWQVEHLDRVNGAVFNVGGGTECSLSLAETTRLCTELTGNKVSVRPIEEESVADVRIYISDTSVVRTRTGWAPKKTSRDILRDIFTWINKNDAALRQVLAP
ncbi:MAG: NAD-dependent epimerase/dehydratase family protein [Deltaproteobacteria bacterium]